VVSLFHHRPANPESIEPTHCQVGLPLAAQARQGLLIGAHRSYAHWKPRIDRRISASAKFMLRCSRSPKTIFRACAVAQGIKSSTELALTRKSESSTYVIDFPNHSRSYDSTRRAVRFWGHDSAIEASFFISEDALRRIQPDAPSDESGFLNAFDSNRDLICAAAAKLYVRGSRGSYDLAAANF
jgi:Protein of unknown function (DUF1488)